MSEIGPLSEVAIVAVGPLSNLILAAIAALFVRLLKESLCENTVQYFASINWRLFWMNLLPFWVLDGGRLLHGIVWEVFGSYDVASNLVTAVSLLLLTYFLVGRSMIKEWRKKRGIVTAAPKKSFEDMLKKL